MKNYKINQIIEEHVERLSHFEAGLELLSLIVGELKKNIGEMKNKNIDRRPEIQSLKKNLEDLLANSFAVEESSLIEGFVRKNVLLCDLILKYGWED